ncbi:hypothetical protein V1477_021207 [Vespula maculifrons]|uniref:Uncharacterized protein n=1 Tax=Vespula maculifrons TaxID=7453 RepID=A0ABD2AGH0_VESMC
MIENTYEDEKEDETTVLDDEVLKDQCGAVLYSLERWYEEMGFYQRIQTTLVSNPSLSYPSIHVCSGAGLSAPVPITGIKSAVLCACVRMSWLIWKVLFHFSSDQAGNWRIRLTENVLVPIEESICERFNQDMMFYS